MSLFFFFHIVHRIISMLDLHCSGTSHALSSTHLISTFSSEYIKVYKGQCSDVGENMSLFSVIEEKVFFVFVHGP